MGELKGLFFQSLWAIGGGVAARSVPQALLKEKNVGVVGYAANLITAYAGSMLADKFGGNGGMVLVGGIVMTAGRMIEEFVGQKLVEFGQINLPIPGLSGDTYFDMGMGGEFINASYPVPLSSLGPASKATLALPPSPEAAAVAPALARRAGVGGLWGSSVWN